jgi:hypothetical protein
MHGDDTRMIQGGSGSRLQLKAANSRLILRMQRRQQFQRDLPPETRVLSGINISHATAANQADHAIRSYRPPYQISRGGDTQVGPGIVAR